MNRIQFNAKHSDTYINKLIDFDWHNDCFYKTTTSDVHKLSNIHNDKNYRTFLIDPLLVIEKFLNDKNPAERHHPATIKEDLAEMLYYESERIAPISKERKNKAYEWCVGQGMNWAKELKIKD